MQAAATGTLGTYGRVRATLALPVIALLLAGCAGIDGTGGGGNEGPMGAGNSGDQGGFGSTMQTTTVAAASQQSPATRGGEPSYTPPVTNDDFTCPKVEVRGGAAAWQVTDKTDGALRYQATLGQFSRECRYTTPDMNMRVGIQGRVLLGTKGGPGKINVPIRLALVEEGPVPKPVWTKFYSVPVEIGEGVMQVDFAIVADDVNFPRPAPATLDRYLMYVGFDPQGATEPKPTRPRAPAQAARPRPVQPAATQAAPAQTATPRPAQTAPARTAPTQAIQSQPVAPVTPSAAPAQAASPPATAPAPAAVATQPAPAASSQTQWIGTPAPSTGGFSQ